MTALWHMTEVTVYTGAAPVAWTPLDLSAYVGANDAWAVLCIEIAAGTLYTAYRPLGDADDWSAGANMSSQAGGCANLYSNFTYGLPYAIVPTDSSGRIEWKASAATGCTLTLVGYVDGITVAFQDVHDANVAINWNSMDASATIAGTALAYIKSTPNVDMPAGRYFTLRPPADTRAQLQWQIKDPAPANKTGQRLTGGAAGSVSITNAGLFDLFNYAVGAVSADIDLLSHVPLGNGFYPPFVGHEIMFPYGPSPTGAHVDLDLSPAIGTGRKLAVLRVFCYANTASAGAYFRAKGSAHTVHGCRGVRYVEANGNDSCGIVVVDTDDDGIVEWATWRVPGTAWTEVAVLGFIAGSAPSGPQLTRRFPDGAISTPPDRIEAVIDDNWGIDTTTVDLTLTSPFGREYLAVVAGVVQAGFTGTVTASGSRATVRLTAWPDGIFGIGERWELTVAAENIVGLAL